MKPSLRPAEKREPTELDTFSGSSFGPLFCLRQRWPILQTGDAVMTVSTEGAATGRVTAILAPAGVEPMLDASPDDGVESMILPPRSQDAPVVDATPLTGVNGRRDASF